MDGSHGTQKHRQSSKSDARSPFHHLVIKEDVPPHSRDSTHCCSATHPSPFIDFSRGTVDISRKQSVSINKLKYQLNTRTLVVALERAILYCSHQRIELLPLDPQWNRQKVLRVDGCHPSLFRHPCVSPLSFPLKRKEGMEIQTRDISPRLRAHADARKDVTRIGCVAR